jgi:hypothetical protein
MPNTARRTYKDMTPTKTTRDPASVPTLTCRSIIDTRKYSVPKKLCKYHKRKNDIEVCLGTQRSQMLKQNNNNDDDDDDDNDNIN